MDDHLQQRRHVSLQPVGGNYLCAEMGGGRKCQANRAAIGAREKFYMESLPGRHFALKTFEEGQFVQP